MLKALEALGFTTPSPIQTQSLPLLLKRETDMLAMAATGTGKTAAFGIPLVENLNEEARGVQALILCPTRELALQVSSQIKAFGKYLGLQVATVYGGSGYGEQIRALKDGAQIVVGTPGRVIDHLEKGTLNLKNLKTIVLDEADEMISMGFREDLEKVLDASPRETTNIWLFSATMSKEVKRVADKYLREPEFIQINRTEVLSSTIEQLYMKVREGNKPEVLRKIIDATDDFYGIIFCQTKALVIELTQYLSESGYKVDCLHGDRDQNSRERTMQSFRNRKVSVLVCTDVAARGLDVKDVTHVINYSLPRELESYVHRIGRTARSGKQGIAISLVTPSHFHLLSQVERITKSKIAETRIPNRKDIAEKKLSKVLTQFQEAKDFTRLSEILGDQWKASLAELPVEEVAMRFLAMMMPDLTIDRSEEESSNRGQGDFGSSRGGGRSRDGGRGGDRRGGGRSFRGGRGEGFGGDRRSSGGGERSFRSARSEASGGEARRPSFRDGPAREPRGESFGEARKERSFRGATGGERSFRRERDDAGTSGKPSFRDKFKGKSSREESSGERSSDKKGAGGSEDNYFSKRSKPFMFKGNSRLRSRART